MLELIAFEEHIAIGTMFVFIIAYLFVCDGDHSFNGLHRHR